MSARAFDVAITVLIAPVALPAVALAACAAAVSLHGNPFFLQERVGQGGRRFRLAKLRTMRSGGDQGETSPITDWGTFVFNPAEKRDSRVSRIGRLLRRTSMDELPNLLNVVRGDMSIVGPRPEIPEIVEQYPAEFHRRHDVRPGITGLAQVRGRSNLAYGEIIKYDLAYVDEHSLLGDLRILAETLRVVLRGLGAR